MSKPGKQIKNQIAKEKEALIFSPANTYLYKALGLSAKEWEKKFNELKVLKGDQADAELKALFDKLPDYHQAELIRIMNPNKFAEIFTVTKVAEFLKFQDDILLASNITGVEPAKINPQDVPSILEENEKKETAKTLNISLEEVKVLSEEEINLRFLKNTGLPEDEVEKLTQEFKGSPHYIAYQVYQAWGISLEAEDILAFKKKVLEEYKKSEPFLTIVKDLEQVEGLSKAKRERIKKRIYSAIDEALEIQVIDPPDVPLKDLGEHSIIKSVLNTVKLKETFKTEIDPFLKTFTIVIPEEPVVIPPLTKNEAEKIVKQPRGYLKTTAKLVGRDTSTPSLFSLPEPEEITPTNNLKEVISRKTAILGNLLFKLWQDKGGSGALRIDSLNSVSEQMETTNEELKLCLLYLGGWVYPIIDTDEDGLTVTQEQLFHIKFRYSKTVRERYERGEYKTIGTSRASFFKGEPVEYVEVTPSPLFVKALEGKGLGNVFVTDNFIKSSLNLSDIAYKILSFSASNKPSWKISEDKLIDSLGLTKQLRTQGRPRVRKAIQDGLRELKDIEHLESWEFTEEKSLYSWKYGNKLVRHKDLLKAT